MFSRSFFGRRAPRLLVASIGATSGLYLTKGHDIGNPAFADTGVSGNNNFIADAAEVASPSVVNITCDMKVARFLAGVSSGSGFVLNSSGYIVTNAHVVGKAAGGKVYVTLWNERVRREARVHALDKTSDLALVKLVDPPADLPVATIGKSGRLRVGEFVVALGSPLMLMNTVTAGIVSATARHGSELGMDSSNRTEYIQTDASINVGNSGGPLVNLDGEVVGVTSMKAMADGISFAIPIDTAMVIIDQLMTKRKALRPYLGIKIVNFLPDEGTATRKGSASRKRTIVESGDDTRVLVVEVEPTSPAANAGVQAGDIINSVNGKSLRGVRDFLDILSQGDVKKPLHLSLNRQDSWGNESSEVNISVAPETAG